MPPRVSRAAPGYKKNPNPNPNPNKRTRRRPTKGQRTARTQGYQRRKTAGFVYGARRELQHTQTEEFGAREQIRADQSSRRIREREAAITERQIRTVGIRRRERVTNQLVTEPAINTARPAVNSVVFVGILAAGLIVIYLLVTTPLSQPLAGIGNVLAAFSQTGPIFSKVQTQ